MLLLLLAVVVSICNGQVETEDSCNKYESCDDCIGKGRGCVWCPDPPLFSGPRCTSSLRANCTSELEDPVAPPPVILRDDDLSETVQISPQEIRLHLRTGEPQTFTLSVKPARNYPLDMYFLMDLSASQSPDLVTLRNLSQSINEGLGNISSQFAIGFGSFVDKIAYPFASTLQNGSDYITFHLTRNRFECANGRSSCEPTYVYRHHLPLTKNDNSQFTEVLERVTLRGNLDAPEAALDALLQSVVCIENVGWRNDSLRIVMILTDAGFKTALDGKVAALLTRNDGECHLESEPDSEGFYDYFRSPEQDFPSIYQVREKLIENDIITIFAVGKNITNALQSHFDVYSLLAEEIGSSRAFVQTIRSDSSDIVSVIREAYESVTRDIVVESVSGLTIAIAPVLNCNLTSDGRGCADVSLEQEVQFNVTVTMDQCLMDIQTQGLPLPGFGSVGLTLVPICECNCTSQMSPSHSDCNEEGSLVCGICNCLEGHYGEQCECDEPLGPCDDDCFNRGVCDNCKRQCISCDTYEETRNGVVLTLGSYGERCECDNSTSGACPVGTDLKLVCSGRGECVCDSSEGCECKCDCGTAPLSGEEYSGPDCGCDPDYCYSQEYTERECAHSLDRGKDGRCGCNECMCSGDSVYFNRICIDKDDLCGMFKSCARCWPMNCTSGDCQPRGLEEISSPSVSCQFERNNCVVDYEVVPSGPFNGMASVFVGEERDCKKGDILGQLAWIIPVSIVGGILLLGVLLLVVAKCILMVIDRKEYKKFLDDMHTGDFTPHSNPLYVTPQIEYKNPAMKKEEDPDD